MTEQEPSLQEDTPTNQGMQFSRSMSSGEAFTPTKPLEKPQTGGMSFSRSQSGMAPKKEYTEENFHGDQQSIADSRTLSSRTVTAPNARQIKTGTDEMGQFYKVETKGQDAAAYIKSLEDSDLTRETLDWLGETRWNMVKMGKLAFDVADWSEDEQAALIRLMAQYEELPVSWQTVKRAAVGLAGDPTTYAGLSAIIGAFSKITLKPAAQAALQGLMKKTAGIAAVTGVETAAYTATDDLFNQKIQVDTGNQEGYDLTQTATAGAIGFAAGATIGGVIGGIANKAVSKKTPRNFTELLDEQMSKGSDEVTATPDEVVDDVADDIADEVTDDEYADELAAELAEETDEFADEWSYLHDVDSGSLRDVPNDELPTVQAGDPVEVLIPHEDTPDLPSNLKPTTVMPSSLRGAKPRYGYSGDNFNVKWESDIDKALYIIAGKGKSKSHDEYMAFLQGVFPDKTANEITLMGHEVKGALKVKAKLRDTDLDDDLVVNQMFPPSKKPRRAKGQGKATDLKPETFDRNRTADMPYNVMKMETSDDIRSLVLQRSARYLEENPRTPQTLEDVVAEGKKAAEELAETTGGDIDEITKVLKGDIDELRIINSRIKATRDLHVWAFDEMVRLAQEHKAKGLNNEGTAELAKMIELVNSLVPITMKQSAEQSRTLGSRRTMAIADNTLITGKIDGVDAEGVERITPAMDENFIKTVNDGDGKLVVTAAVDHILAGIKAGTLKSPRDLKKTINPIWLARAIKEIQRVRAGSMLSGITTLSMAFVSNFYNTWAEPSLHWVGHINLGLTGKARETAVEDALQRTHALAQYTGNIQYMKHGLKQALKAVWEGKHITDPNVTRLENMQVEGWAGKSKKRVAYEVATGWSHVALLALDELHKSTRSMALAQADAIVSAKRLQLEAAQAGKKSFKEGSEEWKMHIQDEIASKFDELGGIKDANIKRQIQMETYTEELIGPIGNAVNGIARWGHGAGGFILPFRRAPLNSISYAMQYITPPIPDGWMKKYKFFAKQADILENGTPVEKAKLHARRKVGGMMLGLAWYMANDGEMTGGGPSNWEQRQAWIQAGNKPYSIKINGEWIPYSKVEPFATVFGTVANIQYITAMDPERYQKGALEQLGALQLSMTEVMLNKAYFSEVGDWMKLMTGEDDMTVKMGQSLTSSFTPNILRQMNDDPYMREANTAMEQIKSGVDGWSQEMGIKYDVLGMPRLKPNDGWFLFKQTKSFADFDDDYKLVSQELHELRMLHDKGGLLGATPKNIGVGRANMQDVYDAGTEESVYAMYNRFIGEAEINGKNLKEAMAERIKSDKYQERPKSVYLDVNSPHVAYLSELITKYRAKAKQRLYRESPAFAAAYDDYQRRAFEVKKGL